MRVVLTIIISTIWLNLIAQDVIVADQAWKSKNLNTSQFNDGSKILEVTNIEDWMNCATNKIPAYCYPSFDKSITQYGKLYNYYAIINPKGIAPVGYKVPSMEDFVKLKSLIIKKWGKDYCGNHLKSIEGWINGGQQIVNSLNFNAEPSGTILLEVRSSDSKLYSNIKTSGIETRFWSTTEGNAHKEYAEALFLVSASGSTGIYEFHKGSAFSVRCIKDNSYVNTAYKEKVDTLTFDNGFCYHEIESCQSIFKKLNGETVEFQEAYYELGEFADENWETGSIKEEYKGKKFLVRYKLIDISKENSFMGEAYSKNQIVEIKLLD